MPDCRFFPSPQPILVSELASRFGGMLVGVDLLVHGVAPLQQATANDLSFLDNPAYKDAFANSAAGVVLVREEMQGLQPAGMSLLVAPDPYRLYARIAQFLYPAVLPNNGSIHPSAVIAPSAILAADVVVEAGAVIGERAEIGAGCWIQAGAIIGAGVVIGAHSRIGYHASVSHAVMGERVYIYTGARIGQDGFGFAMGRAGHIRIPQLGRVIIGHDVEIGANSTVDRGAGPDTVIGNHVMIDNLVQIGHNVTIGDGTVVVAQVGISGSTTIGSFVAIGGQAGIAGHLTIGAGARIAAQSGVIRDVDAKTEVMGYPAMLKRSFFRQVTALSRLAENKTNRKQQNRLEKDA
ncbi:MAG: UDP-3-O-(3-hydroxymyristoyl)glucosamine N-acyltransferase [Alphaproteobacteria bacterium]